MGFCLRKKRLLLLKHSGFGPEGHVWSMPGGGVHFGESLQEALVRECKEETNLDVCVKQLLFLHEHLVPPLHAVEICFCVEYVGGQLRLGEEVTTSGTNVLEEARYFSVEALQALIQGTLHARLQGIKDFSGFLSQPVQYTFCKDKKNS